MKKTIQIIVNRPLHAILVLLVAVIAVMGVVWMFRSCSSGDDGGSWGGSASLPPLDAAARLDSIVLRPQNTIYGLSADDFDVQSGEIESGETLSKLLNGRYNVSMSIVNDLIIKCKGKMDLRDIRAGNIYTALVRPDSTQTLCYLIYERNKTDYVTFSLCDSIYVRVDSKEVVTEERYVECVINSSLYGTIYENGLNPMLGKRLDDIFKWTIDFFALRKGDRFRVLYEEEFIDTVSVGVGKVYGAEFIHADKSYWGIRFQQGDELSYWDLKGKNMKMSLLRAPLSFQARISSKFGVRIHPIRRVRQQHNGVDYAAPSGTPVLAVGNGVVIKKGWDRGGGGNMIKIRHTNPKGVESGYLHLRGFAKNLRVGSVVRQGDVIGYVGSTGMSTGPHLDFRLWRGGKPVDPTKNTSVPTEPISAKYRADFDKMRDDVMKVMESYQKK